MVFRFSPVDRIWSVIVFGLSAQLYFVLAGLQVFADYEKLLHSENYVTKRQSLKVLNNRAARWTKYVQYEGTKNT